MSDAAATVFVVDDDESMRKAVARLLRASGYGVEAYASARDFLDHEPPEGPACLVLDVRMPGVSGLDLQRDLRRAGLDIPVVFITGHGDVSMSVTAMKAGAVDFLQKPFEDHQLLDAVTLALERDRAALHERRERASIQRRVDKLTPRERQVLELVIHGLLNKQIATRLGASEKTIKVHRGRVMEKMEAGSVAELVRMTHKVEIHGPE